MNCAIIQRKISLFYNWWKAKKILSKHSFKNNDIVKNEFFHFTLVNLFYLLDIFIMLIWIALTFLKYILLYQVAVNQFQRKENCKGSTFFVTMIQFSSFEARSQILLQLSCYNKIRSVAQCLLKGSKPSFKKWFGENCDLGYVLRSVWRWGSMLDFEVRFVQVTLAWILGMVSSTSPSHSIYR